MNEEYIKYHLIKELFLIEYYYLKYKNVITFHSSAKSKMQLFFNQSCIHQIYNSSSQQLMYIMYKFHYLYMLIIPNNYSF